MKASFRSLHPSSPFAALLDSHGDDTQKSRSVNVFLELTYKKKLPCRGPVRRGRTRPCLGSEACGHPHLLQYFWIAGDVSDLSELGLVRGGLVRRGSFRPGFVQPCPLRPGRMRWRNNFHLGRETCCPPLAFGKTFGLALGGGEGRGFP